MMWPQSGRRAAQFAARVDGRQISGSLDDDTAALASLAERLRTVEHPVMRPEFASDLRVRLLEAAPSLLLAGDSVDQLRARPERRTRGTPRVRLSVAGVATIMLGTCVGVGYASTSALPGDPLYPIKRTIERVEVATAGSRVDQGHEQLSHASTRLTEVSALARQYGSQPAGSILMAGALVDFSSDASAGAKSLLAAYADNNGAQNISDLRTFTAASVDTLNQLSGSVPSNVLGNVGAAASLMSTMDARAVDACSSCSNQPPIQLPPELAAIPPVPGGVVPGIPSPASTSVVPATSSSVPPADLTSGLGVPPATDLTAVVPPPGITTTAPTTTGIPPSEGTTSAGTQPPTTTTEPTTATPPTTETAPTSTTPPTTIPTTTVEPPTIPATSTLPTSPTVPTSGTATSPATPPPDTVTTTTTVPLTSITLTSITVTVTELTSEPTLPTSATTSEP